MELGLSPSLQSNKRVNHSELCAKRNTVMLISSQIESLLHLVQQVFEPLLVGVDANFGAIPPGESVEKRVTFDFV